MRKMLMGLTLAAFVFGGVVVIVRATQTAQAMTWGELKCQYLPTAPACQPPPPPPKKIDDNKTAG